METQDTHTLIRGVENSLHYIGGAPNAIVSDNLKAAVIKADKYRPEINWQMEDFARHYRTALLPARARKPKDKDTQGQLGFLPFLFNIDPFQRLRFVSLG